MLGFVLLFLGATLSYVSLYVSYAYAAATMPGRVVYVTASVVGMLIGSTLGRRWFS
jgi:hypothetical protein